jgi:hypothetical protein
LYFWALHYFGGLVSPCLLLRTFVHFQGLDLYTLRFANLFLCFHPQANYNWLLVLCCLSSNSSKVNQAYHILSLEIVSLLL